MYYKYTLIEGVITETTLNEYYGDLDRIVDNVLVTETQRFETEIEGIFELFKDVSEETCGLKPIG